jgi:hypothetical protein
MEASMLMFVGAWRYRCQKLGKVFAGGLWLDVWCLSEDRAIKHCASWQRLCRRVFDT